MIAYSDLYVMQYFAQEVEKPDCVILWQRNEYGMYFADIGEGKDRVHIEIGTVSQRYRPSRVIVKLASPGLGEVHIQEPLTATFSTKYESEDDEKLANFMKRFQAGVTNQHAQRQDWEREHEEERRQQIYQRIFGGGSSD